MLDIQEYIDLQPLTIMRVSGKCRYYVQAHTTEDVTEALSWAKTHEVPFTVLAGGSNVVFLSELYEGLVIHLRVNEITVTDTRMTATCGTPMNVLLLAAKEASLSGLEAFSGLPGTVGGAVRGNAGCFGTETADVVESVLVLQDKGSLEEIPATEMRFGYRSSRIKTETGIVLKATYRLVHSDKSRIESGYKDVLMKRLSKQPKGFSCGSFFKNPKPGEIFSGTLIETAGLKGYTIGDMMVSDMHANYLINKGHASIGDLVALKEYVQKKVTEAHNICLEPEVSLITNA